MTRVPRQMLSSWVRNKRPVGRPRLTYGATVKKALKRFHLTEDKTGFPWHALASDRGLWKSLICPDSLIGTDHPGIERNVRGVAVRLE